MDGPNSADWLSAASAAVQAIGAVVAIWYTARLARQGAEREAAASIAEAKRAEAAAERELAFERNAVERQRQADQAADARMTSEQDEIITLAKDLGSEARDMFIVLHDDIIARTGHEDSQFRTPIAFSPPTGQRLQEMLPTLSERVRGAKLIAALTQLAAASGQFDGHVGESRMGRASRLNARVRGIDEALDRIDRHHSTAASTSQ